jgi:hypothetical protein
MTADEVTVTVPLKIALVIMRMIPNASLLNIETLKAANEFADAVIEARDVAADLDAIEHEPDVYDADEGPLT